MSSYQYKRAVYDGKHVEELLSEISVNGRNIAYVKKYNLDPRHYSDGYVKYVVRVDISEYYNSYGKCYSRQYTPKLYEIRRLLGHSNAGFINSSPGWWNNGFVSQLCLEYSVFCYNGEVDMFKKIIARGIDPENFDLTCFYEKHSTQVDSVIDILKHVNPPCTPGNDF